MHQIYLFPTLLGLAAAAVVMIIAKGRRRSLLASGLLALGAGAVSWFVTLFATVVMMVPPDAHG